jgi:hypothetical protein
MLDLSHIHLATFDIAAFATKPQAKALAKARGWNTCDVIHAFNRFNIFWVVGDRQDSQIRLATRARGTVLVPYRPTALAA